MCESFQVSGGLARASDEEPWCMCGIAGLADFTRAPIDPALLETMVDGVRHRGPDGTAAWIGATCGAAVGLGHRRLAVIDLSDTASQPMHNTHCASVGRASAA